MESHRFLTHTCSSVLQCMGFPRQKLGNYFQLQSHPATVWSTQLSKYLSNQASPYLMASTLNLSFQLLNYDILICFPLLLCRPPLEHPIPSCQSHSLKIQDHHCFLFLSTKFQVFCY